MKGFITVVNGCGYCLVISFLQPKYICCDGCTYKGNTVDNILVDVSGWLKTSPMKNNVSMEWCILGDSW